MKRVFCISAGIVTCLFASATFAQSSFRLTPYLWGAGFKGTVGAAGGGAGVPGRIDVDTSGLSDSLRVGGVMLHANWRDGRWTIFGDWTYADAKADSPTRFAALYAGADVKVRGNIVEAYGGYDIAGARDTHVDVFGGARYYNVNASLGLREGILPGTMAESRANWTDGVAGIRWDTRFADHWEAFASADVGAGGSDLSWQLFGGIGYRFPWGSLVGGWRHLDVDTSQSNFKLDGALSGPFLGASFQF